MAKFTELYDLILDSFLEFSMAHKFGSKEVEIVADTAVTFASLHNSLVSGRIISKIRSVSPFQSSECGRLIISVSGKH